MYWIPGHTKITSQIITDNLSKLILNNESYNDYFIELEEVVNLVNRKFKTQWQNDWKNMRGIEEYSKVHLITIPTQPQHSYQLSRKFEIISNRLRLTTNNLNYYQFKIGKTMSPLCDICRVNDTTIHFLTECTKHNSLHQLLKGYTKSENIPLNLNLILNNTQLVSLVINYIVKNNINI